MRPAIQIIDRVAKERNEVALVGSGFLSPIYTLSSMSQGRQKEERPSSWRTCFELDRDRVIHSNSYRRLRDKAQVHILPKEQNLTTRLIHTEEVYQIADSICNFLGLNRTLAEAIARGHDLGHTPFGHVGESALTDIMQFYLKDKDYLFDHAVYGLHVIDSLERDGRGLNATAEVRDGILNHSTGVSDLRDAKNRPFTPEGMVVLYSDKIAYTAGDLEDAMRVGILDKGSLPKAAMDVLGLGKPEWIRTMIEAVVESSVESQRVDFHGPRFDAFTDVRKFMYKKVYGGDYAKVQQAKSKRAVRLVFDHIMETRFQDLEQRSAAFKTLDEVACMTDVSLVAYLKENIIPSHVY